MKYVVLHTHPEGLVLSRLHREQLFSTGNVIEVRECPTYSVQKPYIAHITARPLVAVLWRMSDRYDAAAELGVEVVKAESYSDALWYCEHKRPSREMRDGENGPYPVTVWREMEGGPPDADR